MAFIGQPREKLFHAFNSLASLVLLPCGPLSFVVFQISKRLDHEPGTRAVI